MRQTKRIADLQSGDIVATEPEGSAMIQRVRPGDGKHVGAIDVCWKYVTGPKRGHLDQAYLNPLAEVFLP